MLYLNRREGAEKKSAVFHTMKKYLFLFGFLSIFIFPAVVSANCYNASGFGDNSANGVYFDNSLEHNSNPSYANQTGYYIYTYVQDSVYYGVVQSSIIDNDTPGVIWYYKETTTPEGEYATLNGSPEPGGVISQIDCPTPPPSFNIITSDNIENISYIATSTKINAYETVTVAAYKIPAILFCFVAIIFLFCLLAINPIINSFYKK